MPEIEGPEAGIEAYKSLDEYIEHGDAEDFTDACRQSLAEVPWSELQQAGWDADIDMTDAPTKKEVQHRLADAGVFAAPGGDGIFQEQDGQITEVRTPTTMSESATADETEESETEQYDELGDHAYGDLQNLARSMNEQFESVDINTDAPKKDEELVPALAEYDPEGSRDEGWTVEVDGSRQEVSLLAVQTPDKSSSSGGITNPSDETILYCLTRAATTEERIKKLQTAIEENSRFTLEPAGNGDKVAVVLPAEAHEDYVPPEEQEEMLDEESDGEAEDGAESDSSEEQGETSEEDEESESEPSEGADEAESDEAEEDDEEDGEEDAQIRFGLAVERLMDNNTKDELYKMAADEDIDGRTNMDKEQLAEALAENNPDVAPRDDD